MEEARQAKGIDNTKGKERDTREPDNSKGEERDTRDPDNNQRKRGEAAYSRRGHERQEKENPDQGSKHRTPEQ